MTLDEELLDLVLDLLDLAGELTSLVGGDGAVENTRTIDQSTTWTPIEQVVPHTQR